MDENRYVTAARAVPRGETRSFQEIASLAGTPSAARAAGRALTSYPAAGKAPWQRAVTTDGKLSIDPARARLQLERLRREGARPRAGESVPRWAKRVGAWFVGHYRDKVFAERSHPALEAFDPRYVEAFRHELAGIDRGFEHVNERAIRRREEADLRRAQKRAAQEAHAKSRAGSRRARVS